MILISLGLMAMPLSAHADAQTAAAMCGWLDSHDFTNPPCTISLEASTVNVRIETSREEGGEICDVLATTVRNDNITFAAGWRLRILDPRRGNQSVAECRL